MVDVTAPRFKGLPQFAQCLNGGRMTIFGFDSNGDLIVDGLNDPNTVSEIQSSLKDLGYDVSPSGNYDATTADIVRKFKSDQKLAIPSGLIDHDGVTGQGTAGRLNLLFTSDPLDEQVLYTDRKSHYTNVALGKAHVQDHPDWVPEFGFQANRATIIDVYGYYRDTYLARPDTFLWAGLGRMAGGAVVGGLDSDDVGLINQTVMVRIGQDIFFDLAWQHEAFLDSPDTIEQLAGLHDRFNTYPRYDALGAVHYELGIPARPYKAAWQKIMSGDPTSIADGNRDLLENEQTSIVQPQYDFLRSLAFAGMPTPFTNQIHPYHKAFIVERPQGDVLSLADRWAWISGNMWNNWVASGPLERSRLVALPFDGICRGDFGVPGRPDLLPPGGP